MRRKIIFVIFGIFLGLVFSSLATNAAQSFSATPTSLNNIAINTSTEGSKVISIQNTGNESITVTITKVDLTDGSTVIPLSLSSTTYTIPQGLSQQLIVKYESGVKSGTFVGSITITNSQNASQVQQIPISLAVSYHNEAHTSFKDFSGTTITMEIDIDDSSESETFVLTNDGNVNLEDIEIDLDSSFDGNDEKIEDNDFEINGRDGDSTYKFDDEKSSDFKLEPGQSTNVKLRIDIPSNLDVDEYIGDVIIRAKYGTNKSQNYTGTFTLIITGTSDDEDVYIYDNSINVRNGVLEVVGEPGETLDNIDIEIKNDAKYDVEDLTLVLDGDLNEEDSSKTIPKSAITFSPNPFDVYEDDNEKIEFKIDIPDDQGTGTYLADIELRNKDDKKLDEITLRVKVTGDIYIKEIKCGNSDCKDASISPDGDLDLYVTVANKGSQIFRNVKVSGALLDIDSGNSDIYETASSFILNVNDEKTANLRFAIPDDATDGEHTLELTITYGDSNEITELENINIERPANNMVVKSYSINPRVAKCDDNIYTYIKFQNLGKFDRDVTVSAEVKDTNIIKSSSEFTLKVDDIDQENIVLDISTLDPGTYTVIQKISYNGQFETVQSDLKILECTDGTVPGIEIKPINDTEINMTTNNTSSGDTVNLFGTEFQKTTVYLGSGLTIVILLIIVGLFLL